MFAAFRCGRCSKSQLLGSFLPGVLLCIHLCTHLCTHLCIHLYPFVHPNSGFLTDCLMANKRLVRTALCEERRFLRKLFQMKCWFQSRLPCKLYTSDAYPEAKKTSKNPAISPCQFRPQPIIRRMIHTEALDQTVRSDGKSNNGKLIMERQTSSRFMMAARCCSAVRNFVLAVARV